MRNNVNIVLFNVATRMEMESVNTLKGNVLNNMLNPSEKGLKKPNIGIILSGN